MRALALSLSLSLVLALSGCAADSPRARLQERANALVEAANARDASGVRAAAELFLREVAEQEGAADLAGEKAQRLTALANRIRLNAGLLEQAEEPSLPPPPIPSPTSAPPSPTTRSPEPDPQPEESEPEEPEESSPPAVLPSIVVSREPDPSPSES